MSVRLTLAFLPHSLMTFMHTRKGHVMKHQGCIERDSYVDGVPNTNFTYMMYVYDEIPDENSAIHGNGSIFFGF